jgi:hypothetical protein
MALVKGSIANMLGGISQQAPTLRLPGQSTDDVNTFPVIVEGLTRRPPTEHIAVLPALIPETAFIHSINRDTAERYDVSIADGVISVVGIDGVSHTVSYPDGAGYLSVPAGTEKVNFTAVTIADYTFIVNKTVTAALSSETSPARLPEALVNVISGNYGKAYNVRVNGTDIATNTTPPGGISSDSAWIGTDVILVTLFTGATPALGTMTGGVNTTLTTADGWGVAWTRNYGWIQRLTGVDFTIEVSDGWGGKAMKVIKGTTQNFTDLPVAAPDGFVARVVGDQATPDSVYYVTFKASQNGETTPGSWVECPQPNIKIAFDAATMPHILVRNPDGTFTFKVATWDKRVAGDENTCPSPSFVGSKISDVSFFANRLGLITANNTIWSRSGDFFNFWRTSAVTLLDTDPIDVNAAAPKVSKLRTSVPYQGGLIVWSDQNQFRFGATTELVSPKTVTMLVVSEYESLVATCRPVSLTRRIVFPFDRTGFTGIKEWYYDVYYHVSLADEITGHVPTLIPSGVYGIDNSNTEDLLVVLSTGDRSSLWLYKYLWKDTDKLQSSWVRWNFPGAVILDAFIINSILYLTVNRAGQTVLEKVRLTPGLTDSGAPVTYLDHRIGSDALATPTYDVATGRTTYVLPYPAPTDGSFKAVTRSNNVMPQFVSVPVESISGNTIALAGDTTDYLMWFGSLFESRHTYSPIYVRDAAKEQVVQEGKLQLLTMGLTYQGSGYFRVEVTPGGRAMSAYEFDYWKIGDALADIDSPPKMLSGVFPIPVYCNNENVTLSIVNDSFLPSRFTRTEWKGNFVPKTRK